MRKLAFWSFILTFAVAPLTRADDAEAKAILQKAIKATGGADKLENKKAGKMSMKGTVEANGMTIDFVADVVTMMPDKVKSTVNVEVAGMKFTVIQIFDGKKIYASANGMTMELDMKEALDGAKEQMHGYHVETLVPLVKDKAFKLSSLGEIKLNDKPAVGVKVEKKGFKDVNLYFDKTSGLLVKREGVTLSPALQEVSVELFYSDFKEIDGLKVPTKLLMNQDGKKFMDVEITEQKTLDKVDDSEFAKP